MHCICISPELQGKPCLTNAAPVLHLACRCLEDLVTVRNAQYRTAIAQQFRSDTQSEVLQPMYDGFVVVLLANAREPPPMCGMPSKLQWHDGTYGSIFHRDPTSTSRLGDQRLCGTYAHVVPEMQGWGSTCMSSCNWVAISYIRDQGQDSKETTQGSEGC